VQELIGQKCWAANLSYGAELYLDCRAKRQYQVGPMRAESSVPGNSMREPLHDYVRIGWGWKGSA
jgi:hypothetical protein